MYVVVVGLVAGRALELVDAGSEGEVDPHLGDQHPFDVEGHQLLRPHMGADGSGAQLTGVSSPFSTSWS